NRQMLIATAETTTATTCVGDFGSSRKVSAAKAASSAAPGMIDISAGSTFSSRFELRLKIGVRMSVEIIQHAPERLMAMRATKKTARVNVSSPRLAPMVPAASETDATSVSAGPMRPTQTMIGGGANTC